MSVVGCVRAMKGGCQNISKFCSCDMDQPQRGGEPPFWKLVSNEMVC